jgi:hypothetical protein
MKTTPLPSRAKPFKSTFYPYIQFIPYNRTLSGDWGVRSESSNRAEGEGGNQFLEHILGGVFLCESKGNQAHFEKNPKRELEPT